MPSKINAQVLVIKLIINVLSTLRHAGDEDVREVAQTEVSHMQERLKNLTLQLHEPTPSERLG